MTKLLTRFGFLISLSFVSVELSGQYTSPYIDVRSYHVRAIAPYAVPAIPGITANCTATSATLPISNASSFIDGDGVTVFGCGPANNVTTPTGLAVTPSIATGPTGIPNATVAAPAGATSYCYTIIARDRPGGLTAAPTKVCTSTGAASLGLQSVAVSGWTRSGSVVTATTSAPHTLSVGAMVYMHTVNNNADNYNFGGWNNVTSVPDNTHFTYNTGLSVANGAASVSNGGGTVIYYNANHLTWTSQPNAFEYYIYGRVSGSLRYIGTSRVQSSANNLTPDTEFDDYGATFMNGAVAPYFVPTTPPVAALADPLVTTIASGAGTTTLTLATAASTPVTGTTILFDNTPNIQTAASHTVFNSLLYFPGNSNGYVVNSYLKLGGAVSVSLAGSGLNLNDTMEVSSGDKFFGMLGAQSGNALSFGFPTGGAVTAARANPGIYGEECDGCYWDGILFTVANNQGNAVLLDDAGNSSYKYLGFSVPGLMAIGFINRASAFLVDFDHIACIAGQSGDGSTATPCMLYSGGDATFSNMSFSGRSLVKYDATIGPGVEVTVNGNTREQAGVMPFLTLYVGQAGNEGGSIALNGVDLDTMNHSTFALLGPGSTTGVVSFQGGSAPFSGFGWATGKPGPFITGTPNLNGVSGYNTNVITSYNFTDSPVNVVGLGEFMVPIANNTAPGATLVAGSLAAGTYGYEVSYIDAVGNESLVSPYTNVTVNGRQGVTITPAIPAGAVNYNIYRGAANGIGAARINCSPLSFPSFTDNGSLCGNSIPFINRAGASSISSAGLSASTINLIGGGFKNVFTFNGTANRTTSATDANDVIPSLQSCGATTACAKTAQTSAIITYFGPLSLVSGTVTLTSLPFTSATSFVCTTNDSMATAAVQVVYNSGSSVTFNGTGTDAIRGMCVGN